MKMRHTALALAMIVGTTALAGGGKGGCTNCATVTLVPVSNVLIDPIFETFVGSADPDGATFDVTGSLVIEASDYNSPASLTLHELSLTLTPSADFAGDADIDPEFGSASYTLSITGLDFVGAPVDSDGPGKEEGLDLQFSSLPVDVLGTDSATGTDLAGVGDFGPITGLLAAGNPYTAALRNVIVTASGGTVSLSAELELEPIALIYETGLVETRINPFSGVLNAEGPEPLPGCNEADLDEPFGLLDLADINAFVTFFQAMDPRVDYDNNGLFDLTDITTFVSAFSAGCP